MNNYKNKIIRHLLVICLFGFILSCEEEDIKMDTPDQLFRPASFLSGNSSNNVKFTWIPIANASYILEISRDSFLFETDYQVFSFSDVDEYTVEDLWSNSRYSARIKAVSNDISIKDSEYKQITFISGSENLFYSVPSENIGNNWVILKWDSTKKVDKIIVSSEGKQDVIVPLSNEDITIGEKRIEGLSMGTNYSFVMYLGERPRAAITLKTYPYNTVVTVDQTQNGNWVELGTFDFIANAGAYVEIKNEGTEGIVMADAFKFTRNGVEVIADNTDASTIVIGNWTASSSSPQRVGTNYLHDGNANKGLFSIKYFPDLPESGSWTVSIIYAQAANRATNVPVGFYLGE